MEEELGATFRFLRQSKNISLSAVADEFISKGMLSKFERNISDISANRFFHLLNKINVTPTEFFFVHRRFETTSMSRLLQAMQKYVIEGNNKQLHQLYLQEYQRFQKTDDLFNQLNAIMLACVLQSVDPQTTVSNEDIDTLIDYLFTCENWGQYELVLYGNALQAFPTATVIAFSKEIPAKIMLFKEESQLLATSFNVILNSFILCIEQEELQAAKYFLASLKTLELPETMIFEFTLLNLYEGIFLSKFKLDEMHGNQQILTSLNVFKSLQANRLYEIFSKSSQDLLDS